MSISEEPDDVNFKSKLDHKSKEKAREELGESVKDRLGAVQSFRSLVQQQPWLRTPTEFSFLLRFLRARKFSQLLARDQLENYWTIKTKYPEWFRNIDPADKKLQEFLRCGRKCLPIGLDLVSEVFLSLEKKNGSNANLDEIKKFGVETLFRSVILVCEWLSSDENVQVQSSNVISKLKGPSETLRGLFVLVDFTGANIAHHTQIMNIENAKKMAQFYQHSLPARMKGFHIYNEPPFLDVLLGVMRPLMKEKMRNRMHFHGKNMTNVYEVVDKSVLPDEFLPDDHSGSSAGPEKQIIEDMITDMNKPDFRNYIKDLTSDKYGVDLEQSKSGMHPVSSFRKLNTD